MKIFWGFTEKSDFQGDVHKKIYRVTERGTWAVCRFKGGFARKSGLMILRGEVDNPKSTLCFMFK